MRKKVFKERYNAAERTKDPDKVKVNQIISDLAKTRASSDMIILDCEKLQTLKYLKKAGVDPDNIMIPNPFVFNKIRKYHTNTYNMLLGKLLDNLDFEGSSKESIGLAFFDYMCSLEGNNDISPEEDIKKYFGYRFPKNNSILAVTLSFRTHNKTAGRYNEACKCDMLVGYSAYENGYYAIKLDLAFAYNGMYVNFYKILKQ